MNAKQRRGPGWTPPARQGVSPSSVVLPSGDWPSLLDFLAQRFPLVSRTDWAQRLAAGDVLDANGQPLSPEQPYQPQARIYYYRWLPVEPAIPFDEQVLYQDAWLVVADKPHFMPVTPGGRYVQQSLLVRLKRRLGIDTLSPIHRIDRDTAGLVVFAVQPDTRNAYQALFRERAVHKAYAAIAPVKPGLILPQCTRSRLQESAAFMKMETVGGAPNAETRIRLVRQQGQLGRYELLPLTGQKHQLRAHMDALGIPIVNDPIYPVLQPQPALGEEDFTQPLQLLAQALAFEDPITGEARRFESRLQLMF